MRSVGHITTSDIKYKLVFQTKALKVPYYVNFQIFIINPFKSHMDRPIWAMIQILQISGKQHI